MSIIFFTEDDVDTDMTVSEQTDPLADPNPEDLDALCQLVELNLAFVNTYAQQCEQPVVVSCSLGYHLGPHDGTGSIPEAISALSKSAVPVFSCGNEGRKPLHVQYEFSADKPSFSIGLPRNVSNLGDADPDPANPFTWHFGEAIKGYTYTGQGDIDLRLNVVTHDKNYNIIENVWSSPVIKATAGQDHVVMINSADYPEIETFFRGKVYVSTHTRDNGQLELSVFPMAICKEQVDVASYALTLTMTGSPGIGINLWANSAKFFSDTFSVVVGATRPEPTYIEAMTWHGYPYKTLSGTSMACPTVSGIIALWLQAHPDLTVAKVKEVLANTCDNDEFTAANPIRWGYGKINAKRGLDYLEQTTGVVEVKDGRRKADDAWYSLDGRRLVGQPTQRGIYIYQGKKIIK